MQNNDQAQRPKGLINTPRNIVAETEAEAKFESWRTDNADELKAFGKLSDTQKTQRYARARSHFDSLVHDLIPMLDALEPELRKAKLARILVQYIKITTEQTATNLATGRAKGTAIRKNKAAQKQARVVAAIADLFDKQEKPGWHMTMDEIADFLAQRLGGYTKGSMLQIVKREVPKYKKARKEEQASRFQIR